MNDNTGPALAATCLVVFVLGMTGFIGWVYGLEAGIHSTRVEAAKAGAATWSCDVNGERHFKWINNEPEQYE
jgi:hypothetical protein